MKLYVTPGDGTPIYRQIMNQIKYLVSSGRLQPGDEFPTIRGLAQELLVNPNTVARAYRELEALGIVVSRQGSGTRVAEGVSPLAEREKDRILDERVDTLLAEAAHLGFVLEDVLAPVPARHEAIQAPSGAHPG